MPENIGFAGVGRLGSNLARNRTDCGSVMLTLEGRGPKKRTKK